MAVLLEQIRMWVEQLVSDLGYFGIALVMFLENIFPPIPSEVIMPFAGSLAAKGQLSFPGVLMAGTAGALLGAVAIYYIGLWISESRARSWFESYGQFLLMSEKDFDQAMDTFNDHGKKMVLVGRVIPAIRSLISLPAGLDEMNLATFLLFTTLGTTIWNLLLAYTGLLLGKNWRDILNFVDTYELIVWVILGILVVIFMVKRIRD